METKTTPVHPLLVGTTPGPWEALNILGYPRAGRGPEIHGSNGELIIRFGGGEVTEVEANAALIAAAPSLAAENALLAEQNNRLRAETERMRDALYELADAALWSQDDADYKAPEQFTKSYVFGRYLNRMAQIARAAKELHPKPSSLTPASK